ncbi:hypothetical protein DM77_2271 [Burkholderia mallei]|nr:hypothetical protein DM77_2271 [Burkholderia mallei]
MRGKKRSAVKRRTMRIGSLIPCASVAVDVRNSRSGYSKRSRVRSLRSVRTLSHAGVHAGAPVPGALAPAGKRPSRDFPGECHFREAPITLPDVR